MKYLQNLHTHTTFCDGKDAPEQMVISAYQQGFNSIGFSGHSYMYYAPKNSMSEKGSLEYIEEIKRLKQKYADKIDVFLGLEFDMHSKVDLTNYDYLIGAVHYLKIGEEIVGFDRSLDVVKSVVDKYFNGDGLAYAKAYYKTIAKLPEYGKFDIIGHFDLITKHAENHAFFDMSSNEYRNCAVEAIEALKGKIPYFEINTGAIARGYRTSPYPDKYLLKEFKRNGFGVIISSDCHDALKLDCHFNESKELLKDCGFKEQFVLTKNGFMPIEL